MKIYTKTGDKGETSLFGGKRVKKYDIRIEAYGTVDELNSYIGLMRDYTINVHHKNTLIEIQDRLFTIGSLLAADPEKPSLKKPDLFETDVELLEKEIDKMNEGLEPLKTFVLPGGNKEVSFAHIARCVCRRAERNVVHLADQVEVENIIIIYLNRLSDYIFVLSRDMAKNLNAEETPWQPRM